MANDRLYILDKKTGNKFLLAKFWGWNWTNNSENLHKWLEEQQIEENGPVIGNMGIGISHNFVIVNEDELEDIHNGK